MPEAPGAVPDLGGLQVALRRAVLTAIRSCTGPHDLTVEEFAVLNALRQRGPNPVWQVARALNSDSPNVSRRAHRLAEKGLIMSERSGSDRRVVILSLTERGDALAQEVNECVEAAYGDLLAGAGPDAIEAFVHTIERIRENFQRMREHEDR